MSSDRGEVERAIAAASRIPAAVPVTLALDHGRARIAIGPAGGSAAGSVVLIGFDRRHIDAVRGGENDGRTLAHVDVVRGIADVGRFDRQGGTIEMPVNWHAERLAVLVEAKDGQILGAAVADQPPL